MESQDPLWEDWLISECEKDEGKLDQKGEGDKAWCRLERSYEGWLSLSEKVKTLNQVSPLATIELTEHEISLLGQFIGTGE